MPQTNDWWIRQFGEGVKEVAKFYDFFEKTKELVPFDQAKELCDDLNASYDLSLDLLDFVNLGRSLLAERDLPKK